MELRGKALVEFNAISWGRGWRILRCRLFVFFFCVNNEREQERDFLFLEKRKVKTLGNYEMKPEVRGS